MKITVHAKPGAPEEKVEFLPEKNIYIVQIKARPEDGKANDALVRLLARYFHIPQSRVAILRGRASKVKVIKVAA